MPEQEGQSAAASFFGVTLRKTSANSVSSNGVVTKSSAAPVSATPAVVASPEMEAVVLEKEPEHQCPASPVVIAPLPELSPVMSTIPDVIPEEVAVADNNVSVEDNVAAAADNVTEESSKQPSKEEHDHETPKILLKLVEESISSTEIPQLQAIYEKVEEMKRSSPKEDQNYVMATLAIFPLLSALLATTTTTTSQQQQQQQLTKAAFEELRKGANDEICFYGNRLNNATSFILSLKNHISSLSYSNGNVGNVGNVPVIDEQQQQQPSAQGTEITLEGNRYYLRKEEATQSKATHSLKPENIGQALSVEDCKGSTISIEGKLTSVVMDNSCRTTLLLMEPLVSGLELLGCRNCTLRLMNTIPTIVLDDCEAIQIYLAVQDSRSVRILSTKCTEINVLVPGDEQMGQDEWIEMSIPTQFSTSLQGSSLKTEPVKHVGG